MYTIQERTLSTNYSRAVKIALRNCLCMLDMIVTLLAKENSVNNNSCAAKKINEVEKEKEEQIRSVVCVSCNDKITL